MKSVLLLTLALLASLPAEAQVLRPGAGGVGRALAHVRADGGHYNHGGHGDRDRDRGYDRARHYRPHHHRHYGGHRHTYRLHWRGGHYPRYVHYGYPFDYGFPYRYSDYGYYPPRYYSGSAAFDGLWLGALAGGVIGHNSGEFGHNAWRGAAWGAGVGWLLGSVADANRRAAVYRQPAVVTTTPAPVVTPQFGAAPVQQPVTIINHNYRSPSPMSGANALFGRN